MKKAILILFILSISTQAYCDKKIHDKKNRLSTGQKWVIGITSVALLGSTAASHPHQAAKGRKAVLAIGAVAFGGVTIYDHKNRKIAIGANDGASTITLSYRF